MLSAATAGPAFADDHGHGHHGHGIDVTDTLRDVGHLGYWVGDGLHDGGEFVVEEGWDNGHDGAEFIVEEGWENGHWVWENAWDFCPVVDIRLERFFPDEVWLVGVPLGLCTLGNLNLPFLP